MMFKRTVGKELHNSTVSIEIHSITCLLGYPITSELLSLTACSHNFFQIPISKERIHELNLLSFRKYYTKTSILKHMYVYIYPGTRNEPIIIIDHNLGSTFGFQTLQFELLLGVISKTQFFFSVKEPKFTQTDTIILIYGVHHKEMSQRNSFTFHSWSIFKPISLRSLQCYRVSVSSIFSLIKHSSIDKGNNTTCKFVS